MKLIHDVVSGLNMITPDNTTTVDAYGALSELSFTLLAY